MTIPPNPTLGDLIHIATLITRQQTALAFYAAPENWREGCGTGPGRPAPCVADGGARAREALGCPSAVASGEERP